MDEAVPGWLLAEVAGGIQRLLVLRLEGCPPADAVEALALAWADALLVRGGAWDEALDAPRLREAFRRLAAHVQRWPAPADIWAHLPERPRQPELPPPPMSAAQREKVRAILQQLRHKMAS
jgi:hypothetical protein